MAHDNPSLSLTENSERRRITVRTCKNLQEETAPGTRLHLANPRSE
jgi:hypothetical protein